MYLFVLLFETGSVIRPAAKGSARLGGQQTPGLCLSPGIGASESSNSIHNVFLIMLPEIESKNRNQN